MNSDPRGSDLALSLGRNPTGEERTHWRRQIRRQGHENDAAGYMGLRSAADMERDPETSPIAVNIDDAIRIIEKLSIPAEELRDQPRHVIACHETPRWIKCIERMPDDNQAVLYVRQSRGGPEVELGGFDPSWGEWHYGDLGKCYKPSEVTHWMPLPEPPEDA